MRNSHFQNRAKMPPANPSAPHFQDIPSSRRPVPRHPSYPSFPHFEHPRLPRFHRSRALSPSPVYPRLKIPPVLPFPFDIPVLRR